MYSLGLAEEILRERQAELERELARKKWANSAQLARTEHSSTVFQWVRARLGHVLVGLGGTLRDLGRRWSSPGGRPHDAGRDPLYRRAMTKDAGPGVSVGVVPAGYSPPKG
jgi:hypothetical protein